MIVRSRSILSCLLQYEIDAMAHLEQFSVYNTLLTRRWDLDHPLCDLLPDRDAETLAAWLKVHPGIKIISRDRGQQYIQGIQKGAPQAVQVADRFHLLKNLFMSRHAFQ